MWFDFYFIGAYVVRFLFAGHGCFEVFLSGAFLE